MQDDTSDGPTVSVVLATNRASPYLAEAVGSIESQSFDDWELVIVDDGSPSPDSLQRSFAGTPRARIIRQDNRGLATARNVGCQAARGRLVTFIDDDDFWPRRRLEQQVELLASHPEAVGCHGRVAHVDAEGVVFAEGPDLPDEDAALSGVASIGTLMLRRSALALAGWFDPRLPVAEDLDFVLRLGQAGPVEYVPDVLLYYRRHGGNVTTSRLRVAYLSRLVRIQHLALAHATNRVAVVTALERSLLDHERYFGLEAVREARRLARRGQFRGMAAELGFASTSARIVAQQTLRARLRPAG